MTSKTFNLAGDNSDSGQTNCAKISLSCCCLLVIIVALIVSLYAYQSGFGGTNGCGFPNLDENGLSNWTSGASTIAYACLPGFFLESGHSNIVIANCINGSWFPSPPACNFLPLRMDCEVNFKGLVGNISMWQQSSSDPAFIYGLIDYEGAERTGGQLRDVVHLSKSTCLVSNDVENVTDAFPEPMENSVTIEFNSTDLKAFSKAEVHINLIFVDTNTTASLISIHQDAKTFVLPNNWSLSRLGRDILGKLGLTDYYV